MKQQPRSLALGVGDIICTSQGVYWQETEIDEKESGLNQALEYRMQAFQSGILHVVTNVHSWLYVYS